jgi:mannan endo-1,4-beta-mannosidase
MMAAVLTGTVLWWSSPVEPGGPPGVAAGGAAQSKEPRMGVYGDEPANPPTGGKQPPSPSQSPSSAPPVVASAPAAPSVTNGATYRTNGRFLVDPGGSRVVVRGAEQVFWDATWLSTSFVAEVGRSGANTVRILPYYLRATPTGEPPSTLVQIEDMIRQGINAGMLVDVAIDGGTDYAVYLRPEIRSLLRRYERWVVIHAKGESYEASDAAWAVASSTVVRALRGAGYRAPLYVMSRAGGRNLPTLLNQGAAVVAADPLHNVVFGWQAYWGSDQAYQNEYGMSLTDAMRRAAAAPFPIQVGLIHRSDPEQGSAQTIPYAELMGLSQELQLGWLWWDWRMGVDNLTTDGLFGHWAGPGRDVMVDNLYSVARTSVRTAFQQTQLAP